MNQLNRRRDAQRPTIVPKTFLGTFYRQFRCGAGDNQVDVMRRAERREIIRDLLHRRYRQFMFGFLCGCVFIAAAAALMRLAVR